jgi:hypothetical protein
MATLHLSGEATLRPIRMALAIAPGSAAGVRRAVELATGVNGARILTLRRLAASWSDFSFR